MNSFDQQMMQRCLQLARNGLGKTYPNPLVGSVITYNKKIIGEGWHQRAGEPHAEINAINSVKDKSLLKKATLYVNLEPCSHFGKTPPCAHKIVSLKIPKVVIGTRDFASHVNGKGINYLRENGVDVIETILEKEAYDLNKRFFTFHQKKRPFIILKWAETANGFMAPIENQQKWITNQYSKQLVHLWRTQEQAILIGGNTLRVDNPQLNARLWQGNNPVKIIISNHIKNLDSYQLFKEGKTIIFNTKESKKKDNITWISIDFENDIVQQILNNLYEMNIQSLIIEGGKKTLTTFINANAWDETRILQSDTHWDAGIKAPVIQKNSIIKEKRIHHNLLTIYRNQHL